MLTRILSFRWFLWICATTALISCTKSKETETLTLTGSSTVAPLAAEIGKLYEREHAGIRIQVQTGGSSRGVADARRQASDIGMVSRALHDNENDLSSYTIAYDGIGLIVNTSVPLEEINTEQVLKIFRGEWQNWQDLGLKKQSISVIHKAEGRSTSELFCEHFGISYQDVNADIIIGDNEQGIKNVATIPGAIGYVSIGAAETAIENGANIKLLKLDGKTASSESVATNNYPIIRPLNLVVKNPIPPKLGSFIEFASSKKVHSIAKKLDYVPLRSF